MAKEKTFSFDLSGWLVKKNDPDRNTTISPPDGDIPEGFNWNFIGTEAEPWRLMEVAPEVNAPVVEKKRYLSKLEYMSRFTEDELVAIYTAAKQVVQIEIWLEKFKLITEAIDIEDERTIQGLTSLEAAGLIGKGRAKEILS